MSFITISLCILIVLHLILIQINFMLERTIISFAHMLMIGMCIGLMYLEIKVHDSFGAFFFWIGYMCFVIGVGKYSKYLHENE